MDEGVTLCTQFVILIQDVANLRLAAMRTEGVIGPAHRLKVFASFGFVVKNRIGKVDGDEILALQTE